MSKSDRGGLIVNPLEINVGATVLLREPHCEDLRFHVSELQGTNLSDYRFSDYVVEAPCDDRNNPYRFHGRVVLYLRCLPGEAAHEEADLTLFWEEEERFVRQLQAVAGRGSITAAFADNKRRQYRALEGRAQHFTADRIRLSGGIHRRSELRYWVYETEIYDEEAAEEYPMYLLIEQLIVPNGSIAPWRAFRGYSLPRDNIIVG